MTFSFSIPLFCSELSEIPPIVQDSENQPSTSASTTDKDSWSAILNDDSDQQSQDEEAEAPYRVELNRYIKEKRIQDLKADPLNYWKVKQAEYPHLANLARRYLSPPPGSAASERLFSTGKHVLGTTRLRLKPENMEANLFLKYNIRSLGYRTELPTPDDDWVAPNEGHLPPPKVDPDTEPSDLVNAEIVIPSDDEEDNNE